MKPTIVIRSAEAFRAASNSALPLKLVLGVPERFMTGVNIRPDGSLMGTDNIVYAGHPHGAEPYEQGAAPDWGYTIRPHKSIPRTHNRIEIDLEQLTIRHGRDKLDKSTSFELIEDEYPRPPLPTHGHRKTLYGLGFNLAHLNRLVKDLDTDVRDQVWVQYIDQGAGTILRLRTADPKLVLLYRSLRVSGVAEDEFYRPWWPLPVEGSEPTVSA